MTAAPAPGLPDGSDRPAAGRGSARRPEVDAVRGLVMSVMVLDHVRDFLGNAHFDATDLARTTAPIFLTRWITHFCAPTFFLLAGMSAYLSIRSGRRTVGAAARFLVVRGLALVVLEQTALRCLGWYFHFDYHFMNAGVLFGLGWSMVLLAGLVALPPAISLAVGLVIVLGEPAIAAVDLGGGPLGTLWALATRSRDFEPVAGYHFYVSYPPIPWFGAMALGHGLAALAYGGRAPRRASPPCTRCAAGTGRGPDRPHRSRWTAGHLRPHPFVLARRALGQCSQHGTLLCNSQARIAHRKSRSGCLVPAGFHAT